MNNLVLIACLTALYACGSGSGGAHHEPQAPASGPSITTATGQFKDSNVQGLSYVSGEQSGVTNQRGEFTYELHDGTAQDVTLSVGAVEIGTAQGNSLVTPIGLVPADGGSAYVRNIVRFLTFLDNNANVFSGIVISEDVLSLAEMWPQVDFSLPEAEFEDSEAMRRIISDVASVNTDGAPALYSSVIADTLLYSTLDCVYSGVYVGEVSGNHTGDLTLVVTPYPQIFGFMGELGSLHASASPEGDEIVYGYGQVAEFNKRIEVPGVGPTEITGRFPSPDTVEGEWSNAGAGTSGRFSGERIHGDNQDLYRVVGGFHYSDGVLGLSATIHADGRITGTGYDGHRKTRVDITAPVGTVTAVGLDFSSPAAEITSLDDEGYSHTFWPSFRIDDPGITYDPTPTDSHVLPFGSYNFCRLN